VETLMPQSAGIHWRKLRSCVTDRDLTKFSLYSLRHYAGSVWLRDGISLPRVSRMMGHADIATTEQVYIKILRELDETRLREMKLVSDRLGERYRQLGLELPSAPIPMLVAPPTLVQEPVALLPANGTPQLPSVPVPEPTAMPARPRAMADLRAMLNREVLELYDAGMAPDRIARKLKIASSSVRNWIDDRHTEVVYRSKHDTDPATREKRDAEARRLAEEEGLSYREIAERLGMRVHTLRQTAYRQGWRAPTKVKRYIPKQTVEERRAYQHQYDASDARREARKRYWASEKGQEARIRANESRWGKHRVAAEAAGITITPRRTFSNDEERQAAMREAQHRYKTSDIGREKGREDRRKHWERKRAAAQPEEVACECGRTFMRTYRPGRPRTKCEECSPPDQRPPRTEYHRELKRRLRERARAESGQISDKMA
jgi:hypothetical protein